MYDINGSNIGVLKEFFIFFNLIILSALSSLQLVAASEKSILYKTTRLPELALIENFFMGRKSTNKMRKMHLQLKNYFSRGKITKNF